MVVFVGDINCCGTDEFFTELAENWEQVLRLPGIRTAGSEYSEGVFVYRKLPGRLL
jgi:hypothetical protein